MAALLASSPDGETNIAVTLLAPTLQWSNGIWHPETKENCPKRVTAPLFVAGRSLYRGWDWDSQPSTAAVLRCQVVSLEI